MEYLFSRFLHKSEIPKGVRVLTWATSIRWIGWGFAESLIPVFLFTFASGYAQTGLLKSAYDIAFILVLPIVGVLADRVRSTTLIVIGLLLYVFVGTGYLFAGLTGMVIFIIIARFFNGIGYAMDAVGRETYFRRNTPKEKLATVFGYFDTVGTFWWVCAALIGIVLVKFISIPWLLFMITPTVLFAIAIVAHVRKSEPEIILQKKSSSGILRQVLSFDWKLKTVITFNFFISLASATIGFFLPIQVFTEGAGYAPVIIASVVMTLPSLMGYFLGGIFDKKGIRTFGYGLAGLAVLLFALAFTSTYAVQIVIGFLVGVIVELLWVGSEELVTVYTAPDHFGSVDGFMRSINAVGALVGPLSIGILLDTYGTSMAYSVLAMLFFFLTLVFMAMQYVLHHTKIRT